MAKFACARCSQVSVGKAEGLCIRCTFAVESHQDRIARLDQAKAEKREEKRKRTYGQRDTFAYMRVRDTYRPERPSRQSIGPAQSTAKVIREMVRHGTKPGVTRTRFVPPTRTEYVKREPKYLLNKK